MAADASSRTSGRPRPWLLVALAITVMVALLSYVMPEKSVVSSARPSNPRVQARGKATAGTVKPADLDVRLEELKQPRPAAQPSERNPFRFYVPPPPPPPVTERPVVPVGPPPPPPPPPDLTPPPPPPIPLKFIGKLETRGGVIAAFSDCRTTMRGKEGDIIDGRYRLVKIGVESVVMEYLDGRGRTTIRESGQECVGK